MCEWKERAGEWAKGTSERGYCRIISVAGAIPRLTGIIRTILYYKPPSVIQIFQFYIRQYSAKSPSVSQFTLDYHSSSPTQNQLLSIIREKHHMDNPLSHTMIINYPRKRTEIVKVTVSWKRFNNRIEGDFEEESLLEDWITSTCVMFYFWSWVRYIICKFYRI